MNKLFYYILFTMLSVFGFASCGYDNFEEPESILSGNVQYNGQNLQLQGSGGSIQLQAYQTGYELKSPITLYVNQEGRFSARLFNGHYTIVTKDNNGPWVNNRDTIEVDIKGNTEVNIPVTPYFLLSDYNCTLNGDRLTVGFKIQQVVSAASLSYATICIGRTSIVDEQNNAFQIRLNASALTLGANNFSFTLTNEQKKTISGAVKISARVGLRTVDADKSVYTQLLTLNK